LRPRHSLPAERLSEPQPLGFRDGYPDDEALKFPENDHAFLTKGDVFTEEIIETWIDYKMRNEVDAIRLRPHPYEVAMYYDI